MAVSKKKSKAKGKALPKKPVAGKKAVAKKAIAKNAVGKKTPAKAPVKKAPIKKTSAKSSGPIKSSSAKKASFVSKANSPSLVERVKAAVHATVKASTEIVDKYLRPESPSALTPLDDRILVLVDAAATKTAGGLFIPTTVETKPSRGKVIAVGKGKRGKKGNIRPLDVAVGDFVLFAAYAGEAVTLNGTDYLILREEDVLGVSES